MNPLTVSFGISVIALIFAGWLVSWIMKKDEGTAAMKKVAQAIQEGARAFLNRQYRTIGLISLLVAAGLVITYSMIGESALGWQTALAFIFGAASSALSGIVGMSIAVRTNVRSAAAARAGLTRR